MQVTLSLPHRFIAGGDDLGPIPEESQEAFQAMVLRASTPAALGPHFLSAEGLKWRAAGRMTVTWSFDDAQERSDAEEACASVVQREIANVLSRSLAHLRG